MRSKADSARLGAADDRQCEPVGEGGRKDSGDVPSSVPDDLLRGIAAAPERTMPSPRGADGGEPLKLAHFKVLGRLGQGGMGIVYRAKDEKLGRVVALKVLPAEFEADEGQRKRFLREARVAAAVTHPNLTTVHEIGEFEGRVFIAMELVEGRPLRTVMEEGPLPAHAALRVVLQVLAGMAKAHDAGIVHRDLKPENILVGPDGHVKVLDFGLAKQPEGEGMTVTGTGEGMLLGTPAYMSPEQMRGQPVTTATDVFALGVMLHEMLTGKRPFAGKNLPQLVRAVERDQPAAPSSVNPLVPPAFDPIVARCLQKDPAARYVDARAVLDDLRKVEAATSRESLESTVAQGISESVATRPLSTTPRLPAPWRKRGWLVAALAVLAAGAASPFVLRAHPPAVAPSPRPSALAAPHPTALTDLPMPSSTVPEAITEYAAGIQLLRDDSWANAETRFEHAADLDPTMVLAHLRAAHTGFIDRSTSFHDHFAEAIAHRSRLSARDQTYLDVLEPLVGRAQPDPVETLRRAEAAAEKYPFDVEFPSIAASITLGDPARAIPFAKRALELDARSASDLENLGRATGLAGDLTGGRQLFEQCSAISVETIDCLQWLSLIDGVTGRCEDAERDGHREADFSVNGVNADLAGYMTAAGRSDAAVQEVLARGPTAPWEAEDCLICGVRARLAVLSGAFDQAERLVDDKRRALETSQKSRASLKTNEDLATLQVELLRETGRDAEARAVASRFVEIRATLAHGRTDWTPYASWWLLRVSGLPYEATARVWREEALRSFSPGAVVWAHSWARAAVTMDQAKEALDALARDERLAPPRGGEVMWAGGQDEDADAWAGHVELLAGHPADALPYLRRSTANCFEAFSPFEHVHAWLDLGRALEQTGDAAGACEAYGKVVARWGHAKPRSVTAEAAADGVRRLHCGK